MSRIADAAAYAGVRLFFLALSILPKLLAYRLCEGIADVIYLFDSKHRRIGLINLSFAFPEPKYDEKWKQRILRASFRRLGHLAVEISRLHRLTPENIGRLVEYEVERGLENYLEARKQGRGVLFLTAHIGAWELLPTAHALYGHTLSFVVRPLDNPWLEKWAAGLRERAGNEVIPKKGSVVRILRRLKQGGEVGLLIDQNIQQQEGVFVPLFGRSACTSSSLAALALKTRAPVVAGFILPAAKRGRYRIRFYPPIEAFPSGDFEADVRNLTAQFNGILEAVIREFPECWLWGHRRFRTQPDGQDPYCI